MIMVMTRMKVVDFHCVNHIDLNGKIMMIIELTTVIIMMSIIIVIILQNDEETYTYTNSIESIQSNELPV